MLKLLVIPTHVCQIVITYVLVFLYVNGYLHIFKDSKLENTHTATKILASMALLRSQKICHSAQSLDIFKTFFTQNCDMC